MGIVARHERHASRPHEGSGVALPKCHHWHCRKPAVPMGGQETSRVVVPCTARNASRPDEGSGVRGVGRLPDHGRRQPSP